MWLAKGLLSANNLLSFECIVATVLCMIDLHAAKLFSVGMLTTPTEVFTWCFSLVVGQCDQFFSMGVASTKTVSLHSNFWSPSMLMTDIIIICLRDEFLKVTCHWIQMTVCVSLSNLRHAKKWLNWKEKKGSTSVIKQGQNGKKHNKTVYQNVLRRMVHAMCPRIAFRNDCSEHWRFNSFLNWNAEHSFLFCTDHSELKNFWLVHATWFSFLPSSNFYRKNSCFQLDEGGINLNEASWIKSMLVTTFEIQTEWKKHIFFNMAWRNFTFFSQHLEFKHTTSLPLLDFFSNSQGSGQQPIVWNFCSCAVPPTAASDCHESSEVLHHVVVISGSVISMERPSLMVGFLEVAGIRYLVAQWLNLLKML